MATDLERIGDLSRNIAGSARELAASDPLTPPPLLRTLADVSKRSLSRALQAFADLDGALARAVLHEEDEIDEFEARVIRQSIEKIRSNPSSSKQEIELIFIAKSLERVADHATNIAEEVVLATESINLKHAEKLSS